MHFLHLSHLVESGELFCAFSSPLNSIPPIKKALPNFGFISIVFLPIKPSPAIAASSLSAIGKESTKAWPST